MAELVQAVPEMTSQMARMVLPARGSVGRKLELQADTLAAKLAEKLLSDYRMLHLPDNLSAHVLEEMKQDPEVAETIEEMKQADILLLGVGNALEMAERRRLDAAGSSPSGPPPRSARCWSPSTPPTRSTRRSTCCASPTPTPW